MKKQFVLLLSFAMILSLCACGNGLEDSSENTSSFISSPIISPPDLEKEEEELTEAEIESIAAQALYDEIVEQKSDRVPFRSDLDPGSTRYRIANIEKSGSSWVVYGNGTFYDKYGNISNRYSDKSGSPSFSFEVRMSSSGYVQYCEIK